MSMCHRFLLLLLLCLGSAWVDEPDEAARVDLQLQRLAEIMTLALDKSAHNAPSPDMVEGAIQGLLNRLDPHTVYYSADRYRTMKEDQRGSYFGVGLHIGIENGVLTVVSPIADTPAASAGIRAGDLIMAIDDQFAQKMSVSEAIRHLRGNEGEAVNVSLKRIGREAFDVSLIRAQIPTKNVRATFMLDDQTGYISLKDFGETATEEVADAILGLRSEKMQRMILDLRGNPGGLLPQAIGVASLFVPGEKVIVSTQGRMSNANQEYRSDPVSPIQPFPLIVLIDRGSASASEIVAGAIQDHDRGLIVGVTSWGKGLVQSVFPVGNGSKGLALTTARYYTPSGRNIQGPYDSIDEYYHPKSSEQIFFEPQVQSGQKFYTIAGREVLQVRGIVPDVYIAYAKNKALVEQLQYKYNAFFNFATANQDRYGNINSEWIMPEEVVVEFYGFVKDRGYEVAYEALLEERSALTQNITYELLSTKHFDEAWRYLIMNDVHVKASQDLFDEAKELLDVYDGKVPLRDSYAHDLKEYARLHRNQE